MINAYKIACIKSAILQLLDDRQQPMSIMEIGQKIGDSYGFLHLSLSQLLNAGLIRIETYNGQNFVSASSSVSSANQELDESLVVVG